MPTRLTAAEIQCQLCNCFSQNDRLAFSAAFGFTAVLAGFAAASLTDRALPYSANDLQYRLGVGMSRGGPLFSKSAALRR